MDANQVVAIVAFGGALAAPAASLATWLLRQFIPASGSAAKLILWLVALGIAIYSAIALGFWPRFGWNGPGEVAESLAMIVAFTGWVVAAANPIYEKMGVKDWRTLSDPIPTVQKKPSKSH